jgi:hypothetical protein
MGKRERVDEERRRYPRLKSLYLLSYTNREGGVEKSGVSMARTINVSPAGVGVEVYQPINRDSLMEMEIAVQEHIFTVQGKVVHSQEKSSGTYVIGVQFNELQKALSKKLS